MAEPQVPRLELPFFAADRTNLFNRLELIQPRRVTQLAFFDPTRRIICGSLAAVGLTKPIALGRTVGNSYSGPEPDLEEGSS